MCLFTVINDLSRTNILTGLVAKQKSAAKQCGWKYLKSLIGSMPLREHSNDTPVESYDDTSTAFYIFCFPLSWRRTSNILDFRQPTASVEALIIKL